MWEKGLKVCKHIIQNTYLYFRYRVYYNHYGAKDNETNPGEWPWVVAIFKREINQTTGKRIFVASGTLFDKDLVATVAHKMNDYTSKIWKLFTYK